ncbi:MAG: AsmA family protein [Cypionkella sp.]
MRWIIRSVMALVLLVVLAVGALFAIPAEKIAGVAVTKFNTLTGRVLTISGSVRPSFYPQLGVRTGPVSISNAEWSKEGPMLSAEGLSIALDLPALIAGDIKITGIEAIAPKIVLERSAKGAENWVFGGDAGGTVSTATPGVGKGFTLDKAVISGGTIVYADHQAGTRVELSAIEATATIPSYTGAAQIDLSAVLNGQSFRAKGDVAQFQEFLDGKVVGTNLDLTAGAATVGFKGRAGWATQEAQGALVSDLGDLKAISALVGVDAVALPEGLGRKSVQVSGDVTQTAAGTSHLRGGVVVLDGTKLAVEGDYTSEGRGKISGKVTAGALNLATVAGGAGGGSGGGAQAAGWPKDRIDTSALGAMDVALSISADSLNLGLVKFGATRAKVTNERSRLVVDIAKASAYGGAIAGNFVVNGRGDLSVGGDLSFKGMNLQALLRDFGGYERLIGTGDMAVKFLSSGASVDAIMHRMQGSGSIALTRGQILGLDIGGMLRRLDTSYVGSGQKTVFDALTGTFSISGGVLHNEDLLLASSDVTARGVGDVDLGARTQTYRIKATALAEGDGSGGITAPLLITGTWANPKFALDLQALADERLAVEADKVKAAVEAKRAEVEAQARAKLESELGVVQQDGESLQDAAKRAAQDALNEQAAKALGKFLGGN